VNKFISISAWMLAATVAARASIYTYDFTDVNAVIPDGSATGLADTRVISGATAYNGSEGYIQGVTVSVNIESGFNGDLYGYLVSDSGFAVLLNRTGSTAGNEYGYGNTGFNVTFSDAAGADIHSYQNGSFTLNGNGQLTGTWQPDGRAVDPSGAMDTDARTATLASFLGGNPNGTWTLFLMDASTGGQSTLNSWSLSIDVVPEPATWAMLIFAGGAGAIFSLRWLAARRRQRVPLIIHPSRTPRR
jgi:subtilisin-like proprotein convertase family protein